MILILSIFILFAAFPQDKLQAGEDYKIQIIHPGISTTDPVECKLVGEKDGSGQFTKYFMEVESVVCGKSLCKVVPVRIVWNSLGEYEGYEMAPGILLEKEKGKPFSETDYKKLHRILSDLDSPFAAMSPDQIVKYHKDDTRVDGITGSTVLIDTSATVVGATLTCYSLWHWVHGGVKSKIRDITGETFSESDFRTYLEKGDQSKRIFALEQMKRREIYDKRSLRAVSGMAMREDIPLMKLSVGYFEQGPSGDYYSSLEQLIQSGNSIQRIVCLSSLLNHSADEAPAGYYDRLSRQLPGVESFQEVDLLLKLMEKRNPASREATNQAIKLLDKNIIIARRAYWYLNMQELSNSQKQILKEFRRNNQDYL